MVVPAAQAVAAAQVLLEERVPQAALSRVAATGAPGAAVVQAVLVATVLRVRLGRRVATAAMLATAVLVALAVLPVWVPVRLQAVQTAQVAMAALAVTQATAQLALVVATGVMQPRFQRQVTEATATRAATAAWAEVVALLVRAVGRLDRLARKVPEATVVMRAVAVLAATVDPGLMPPKRFIAAAARVATAGLRVSQGPVAVAVCLAPLGQTEMAATVVMAAAVARVFPIL